MVVVPRRVQISLLLAPPGDSISCPKSKAKSTAHCTATRIGTTCSPCLRLFRCIQIEYMPIRNICLISLRSGPPFYQVLRPVSGCRLGSLIPVIALVCSQKAQATEHSTITCRIDSCSAPQTSQFAINSPTEKGQTDRVIWGLMAHNIVVVLSCCWHQFTHRKGQTQ